MVVIPNNFKIPNLNKFILKWKKGDHFGELLCIIYTYRVTEIGILTISYNNSYPGSCNYLINITLLMGTQ